MPLSIVVRDLNPDVPKGNFEAWANADGGKPSGRELEIANLLSFIARRVIRILAPDLPGIGHPLQLDSGCCLALRHESPLTVG